MKHINEFKLPSSLPEIEYISEKEFDDVIFDLRIELAKNWCAAKYYHLYNNDNPKMVPYIERLAEIINTIKHYEVKYRTKDALLKTYLIDKYDFSDIDVLICVTCDMFKDIADTYYSMILSKYFTDEINNLIDVLSNKITLENYIIKTFVTIPEEIIFVYGGVRPKSMRKIDENWRKIFEMALKLKDFKDRTKNLTIQIVENWCLCKYCSVYDLDNLNFNHWVTEFKAHVNNIKSLALKVDANNIKKHILTVFETKYLNNPDVVYETFIGKFETEKITNDKWIETITNEFVLELDMLCSFLASPVSTDDYVYHMFGKE